MNIFDIGVDIIEIDRIRKAVDKKIIGFWRRYLQIEK